MEEEGALHIVQSHNPWKVSDSEFDLFYDPLQKRIILYQTINVYAFEPFERTKDPNPVYFQLPSKYKNVQALAISRNDQYIAIKNAPLHFDFIDFGNPTTAAQKGLPKECGVTFSENRKKILAMTFIKSKYADLIVGHRKGLEIYNYNPTKRSLSNSKSISYTSFNVWIDPLNSFIVLSSFMIKGELQTYYIKEVEKKEKLIKVGTINIKLRHAENVNESKVEKQDNDEKAQKLYREAPQALTKNFKVFKAELDKKQQDLQKGCQLHHILIGKFYTESALIHYNQAQGAINVYIIVNDKYKKNSNNIEVNPQLTHKLKIIDNLLIIFHIDNNQFSAFDTEAELTSPILHNSKVNLSRVQLFKCDIKNERIDETLQSNKSYVIIKPEFNIDEIVEDENMNFDLFSKAFIRVKYNLVDDSIVVQKTVDNSIEAVKEPLIDVENFSEKDFMYLDVNLVYNVKEKKYFTYVFDKENYLRSVKKKIPALINIMRRTNPKLIIVEALKQLLEDCISLHKLSKFFEKLSNALKLSQTQVLTPTQQEHHEVKRITAISPLVEQRYYRPGQTKPSIYIGKTNESTTIFKVSFLIKIIGE